MITTRTMVEPPWVARFLDALRAGNDVRAAAGIAGVTTHNARLRRRRYSDFARAWAECAVVAEKPARRIAALAAPRATTPRGAARLDRFLEELAATSNVSAAAAVAGVAPGAIYRLRRENAEFARRWYAALAEGYDNLEMELLGRLRAGETGAEAKDKRKFDTAAALRCLAAHRESVAREKGRRALAEEAATIAAINAKIDRLRLASEQGEQAIAAARKAKALEARKAARALPAPPARDGDDSPSSGSEAVGRTRNGA